MTKRILWSISYRYLSVTTCLTVILVSCIIGKLPFPPCPFSEFFGFCCSMCASTRAWRVVLLSGNVAEALLYNPIFWLWGFWCTVAYIDMWLKSFRIGSPTLGEKLMLYVSKNRVLINAHLVLSFITLIYLNLPIVAEWRQLMS